jgi:tRNA A64-2'-O-ribosylphosphate transferase
MPDALSKTIPIWCNVLNKAIWKWRRLNLCLSETDKLICEWDLDLHTPPAIVSRSEHDFIKTKIDAHVARILVSVLLTVDFFNIIFDADS